MAARWHQRLASASKGLKINVPCGGIENRRRREASAAAASKENHGKAAAGESKR